MSYKRINAVARGYNIGAISYMDSQENESHSISITKSTN